MGWDEIVNALSEQVECYKRLARLTELQHEHVRQDQTEPLLEVLKSRQQMLDQISALEAVVAPARRGWGVFIDSVEPHQRARATSLLEESRRLLADITSADQRDALVLQQRKLNLGRQIQQTQSARSANRNYGAAAYATPASKMDLQQ
jgi:hypothetical protein